jgi:DNA-binding protein H-NS
MAKRSLTSMSVEELLKLRGEVGNALSSRAEFLKKELTALGEHVDVTSGNGRRKRRSLAGRKVAPKYRNPKTDATWAGRGVQPVWLRDAVKSGKKLDSFLIDKPAKKMAKTAAQKKRGRPAKRKVRRTKSAAKKTNGAAASAPAEG